MEKLKKILASTKTTIILFIIILVLFLICKETVVYRFETLASYLYGTDADNKGKLLSTILTAIGGVCVIWGLWLNNKKVNQQIRQVNEQVRQNDIAVQNSNDKRFGEAIGYLNNDNEGIVIGGIYALYQLAKEDERYAPIITNIFVITLMIIQINKIRSLIRLYFLYCFLKIILLSLVSKTNSVILILHI